MTTPALRNLKEGATMWKEGNLKIRESIGLL